MKEKEYKNKLYYNRGLVYLDFPNRKHYKEAIKDFDKVAKLKDDKLEKIHNYRGIAYAMLEKYDNAEQEFEKALEINPKFSEALKNLIKTELVRSGIKISWWDWWKQNNDRIILWNILLGISTGAIIGGILADLLFHNPIKESTLILIILPILLLLLPQVARLKAGPIEFHSEADKTGIMIIEKHDVLKEKIKSELSERFMLTPKKEPIQSSAPISSQDDDKKTRQQ